MDYGLLIWRRSDPHRSVIDRHTRCVFPPHQNQASARGAQFRSGGMTALIGSCRTLCGCCKSGRQESWGLNGGKNSSRKKTIVVRACNCVFCLPFRKSDAGSVRLCSHPHLLGGAASARIRAERNPFVSCFRLVRWHLRNLCVRFPDGSHVGCRLRAGHCAAGAEGPCENRCSGFYSSIGDIPHDCR